ncbi:DUF4058 family protein [Kamptonema formosum]|uniref:DUF4058 family protein n=1 Tax=Kamptonema formosum TaxID=331992 RepID=UPI00034DB185|nr:DUF4058 family protein [Oscillatoria sp. PCC 10802]
MPSPFPGMNPYLEHPAVWPKVHKRLIVALADLLAPQLRPKYIVDIEDRIYQSSGEDSIFVGIPDVTVQRPLTSRNPTVSNVAVAAPPAQPVTVAIPIPETVREDYLQIRDVATNEVVTALEVLSPKNKRSGEGRRKYELKRQRVLGSLTNLVEIDLLRAGEPMPVLNNDTQSDYRILVSRGDRRPLADLYAFNLRDAIPCFPLPLRAGDREPVVDLKALLDLVYDRGSYDLRIDYRSEPVPALSEADAGWADALLREQGCR